MKTKKFSLLFCLSVLMLIVLSGCKDDTNKKQGTQNNSSNITSGGAVTVGIAQDLDSLDPHKAVYAGTKEVLFNIYEGLVKPTADGDLEPAVASSYKISKDAKTYTFTLRKGLTFHNGEKVTVDDIKYSIKRYADIQGKESAFSNLDQVKIVDNQTIEVKLKEANSEFLAECTVAILPKSNAHPDKNPVGTGPFQVDKFTPGQSLVVKRFEKYRDSKYPYLDKVTFRIVPDTDAAFTQLQGGSLDILQYLTSDQTKTIGNHFNVVEGSVNYVQALFLNNNYGPFKNVKVRQALCYAIDRDAINQFIFEGKSHVIGTNMLPNIKKYYNSDTEKVYKKDLEKAKGLMKEAGYGDGFDLTITVPNNYGPHQTTAEVIVEDLKQIGIRAKINLIEFTSWVSDCYNKRNYQATVVAVDGTLAPNSWFAKNVSNSPNNFTNYKNSQFDKLFAQAKATTSEQDKVLKYKEMQKILAEDAASVYIQDPANLIAVNKKLAGYTCYPVAAQDMSKVGFTK